MVYIVYNLPVNATKLNVNIFEKYPFNIISKSEYVDDRFKTKHQNNRYIIDIGTTFKN